MNILYIDHYAGSLDMGMEFRPYYLAREWKKFGHEVRVVGASFSHLRVKNPTLVYDFEKQNIDGIEYQWIKTCCYDHNGIKRAYTMWQFCFKLWLHAKEIVDDFHPDVVITSSTYPMDTWPAQRIVKLSKAKLIHENHDIWPLTLTTVGRMSDSHPFVKLVGHALKSALQHSDAVVCVLPYAYEYFEKFEENIRGRFCHIPNGIALSDWEDNEDLPEEHKKLFEQLQGKFIVLYLGGHALSNALGILIDSAKQLLDNQNIAFVLVGKGVEKDNLMAYTVQQGCFNVYFLPGVSKKMVPDVLAHGDLLYVGGEITDLGKYGCGINKLYDYMMSSKPIIHVGSFRNKEVVDANAGYVIPSNDVEEIVNAIERVYNLSKGERIQMGQNGHNWVLKNCEYSVLAKKFLEVIEKA